MLHLAGKRGRTVVDDLEVGDHCLVAPYSLELGRDQVVEGKARVVTKEMSYDRAGRPELRSATRGEDGVLVELCDAFDGVPGGPYVAGQLVILAPGEVLAPWSEQLELSRTGGHLEAIDQPRVVMNSAGGATQHATAPRARSTLLLCQVLAIVAIWGLLAQGLAAGWMSLVLGCGLFGFYWAWISRDSAMALWLNLEEEKALAPVWAPAIAAAICLVLDGLVPGRSSPAWQVCAGA
jgi:hypothetical protein